MPEYTLDEIENAGFSEFTQKILFGSTVKIMRRLNSDEKIQTWISLEDIKKLGIK